LISTEGYSEEGHQQGDTKINGEDNNISERSKKETHLKLSG
jgi:hypothetical protein